MGLGVAAEQEVNPPPHQAARLLLVAELAVGYEQPGLLVGAVGELLEQRGHQPALVDLAVGVGGHGIDQLGARVPTDQQFAAEGLAGTAARRPQALGDSFEFLAVEDAAWKRSREAGSGSPVGRPRGRRMAADSRR